MRDFRLLQGTVALITGAASKRGLGRAIAQLFAEQGAQVVLLDLDADLCQQVAAELGGGHLGWHCDVTSKQQCSEATQQALDTFGKIDVLVNNAGITQPLKTLEITEDNYEAVLDVSLKGTLLMSQAVLPAMQQQQSGCIINMSSVSGQRGGGVFGGPHYCAAKAGLLGLTKAMAREFGPDGIRVNAIAPGLIDTDITQGKLTVELKQEITKGIPLGRLGAASDVARACLFLASELSDYITGSVIDVNGGMHMY